MTPRLKGLTVENLRSVGSKVELTLPEAGPLVLLGENNAGKSNLTRGLSILFGDQWPGSISLEPHDFHGRDSDGLAVAIHASTDGIACSYCRHGQVTHIRWVHDTSSPVQSGSPVNYSMSCSSCSKTFMSNQLRAQLSCAFVGADRQLSYQLSYASKFTMLSKLMHRFHEKLLADPARAERLETIFTNLVSEFDGVTQFAKFRARLTEATEDFAQNLSYRLDVDFSAYDPSNFFRSLRVNPHLDGAARAFDELGTGQGQILAMAFAYAYAQAFGQSDGLILVIDEPEAHLHPLAQEWLASRLDGLATNGLQVVLTTHSPYFVDLARPENLAVVRKRDARATQISQLRRGELVAALTARGADPDRTTPESVGEFYAAGSTPGILSALFSRLCVLVEGPTEEQTLPDLLRLVGFDVLKHGVAVVAVGGLSNIPKWARLFTALNLPVYCVFDTDSNKSGNDAARALEHRTAIMKSLDVTVPEQAAASTSDDSLSVLAEYTTLNPTIEPALEELLGAPWIDAYAAAADVVGDSKPLRGRLAARTLTAGTLHSDALLKIAQLADALKAKLGASDTDEAPAAERDPDPSNDEPPF